MKAEAWTLVTGPAEGPLTVDEVKEHLRVDAADEETLLDAYLAAATGWAESYTGRALVTQTWDVYYARWPGPEGFELPLPPLQSVTSIQYTPEGGAPATLAAGVYQVVAAREPGRVLPAHGQEWPAEPLQPAAALPIVVRMVCGYGAAGTVPAGIRQGIRWLVGHMMENREAVTMGSLMPQQVPMTARWALDPYRVWYGWGR